MARQLAFATKVGMTRIYVNGEAIPVTVLSTKNTKIISETDNEALIELAQSGVATARALVQKHEGQADDAVYMPPFLQPGTLVDVVGRTKGHGFTGVIQRHGFSGLGAAHGVKKVHRSGGSVGQNTEPGRVHPGTKMAGRHGAFQRTVRNLKVVLADPESGTLALSGAVPGHRNSILAIRPATGH